MSTIDALVAQLAAHQSGLVSLDQARRLGLTRSAIAHRCRSARWEHVLPGVVRIAGTHASWEADVLAGVLHFGDRAVVSHRSALAIQGLEGFSTSPIEFTGPRGARPVAGLVLHSTRRLDSIDLTVVRRHLDPTVRRSRALRHAGLVTTIRATSVTRALLDVAAELDAGSLAYALDEACRRGLTSVPFFQRRLEAIRTPGRTGARRVDEILPDSGGHSALERRFLELVRHAGLSRPTCQVVHTISGRFIGRVDFDFSPLPLVAEVGGQRGHSSDADRARDARRRNELQRLGLVVLEFTRNQVFHHPDEVMADLAGHAADLGSGGFGRVGERF